MEETRKRAASIVNAKDISSSLDDFGMDFLSSWKLRKAGKDNIDFDVESVPKSNKKFSFGKLDDFELDGAFDNLPSFKMDMSDLDFSTLKKKVKHNSSTSNEFSEGKKESGKDNFSFSFDFNELGKFNLDKKLGLEEKGTSRFTDKADSISLEGNKDPKRGPSGKGSDTLEDNSSKEQIKTQDTCTSKPAYVTGQGHAKSACHLTSIINSADSSDKMHVPTRSNPTRMEHDKVDMESMDQHGEQSDGVCPTESVVRKSAQNFPHSSASGEDLTQVIAVPENCKDAPAVDPIKVNLSREKDDYEQSMSSQSRITSPVNSYFSRRLVGRSDSPIGQNEVVEESASLNEGSQGNQSVRGTSMKLLEKRLCRAKNNEEGTSGPKNLSSTVQREIRNAKPNETGSSSLLCKSANMNATRLTHLTSEPTLNQPIIANKLKVNKINTHPADLKREHKQACTQSESSKIVSSKSYCKPALQLLCTTSVNVKDDRNAKLSLEHPQGNMPVLTAPSCTTHSTGHNIVSSHTHFKSATTSDNVQDTSSKDEKSATFSQLIGARIAKVGSRNPSSNLLLDKKIDVSGSKASPVIATSKIPKFFEGKPASFSPSLRQKMSEEAVLDPEAHNHLKCIMRSPAKRKLPESVLESGNQTDLGNGAPIAYADNVIASNVSCELGDISDLELPSLVENDGNVEKAEACRKELEDICIMLRRKHVEAKELAVRAIVNNNMMLMLNHPMFEQKICALQKFANGLRSKKYLFEEIGAVDAL